MRTFFICAIIALNLAPTEAFTISRDLRIESSPAGATVLLNGTDAGKTPLNLTKYSIKSETGLEVAVRRDGYESQSQKFTYDQAKTATKDKGPWLFNFDLVEVRRLVPVAINSPIAGASIYVNDELIGITPTNHTLVFSRAGKEGKWNDFTVRVEKAKYSKESKPVSFEMTRPEKPNDLALNFDIAELRRDIPFEVRGIDDATVNLDEKFIGKTPLKTTLVYERPNGTTPWPELKLEVQKLGFEYRVAQGPPLSVYTQLLSVDTAAKGSLVLDAFYAARYVLTPVRIVQTDKVPATVLVTNIHSAVDRTERGSSPTPITTLRTNAPLILSRISGSPDKSDQIAISMPNRRLGIGADGKEIDQIVGANIVLITKGVSTHITVGENFDIDPFITGDGKWIYFSSDRHGMRRIWRIPTSGQTTMGPITGFMPGVDTQPAVSPDGQKLAYTSRPQQAPAGSEPSIWTADADGRLPSEFQAGHSPSWSPDGKRIAFINKNKIWIIQADGTQLNELSLRNEGTYLSPVWTPLGKHLVYASSQSKNELQLPNFDIWKVSLDGLESIQLTNNGSMDSSPALSFDGKFLYFFSNRGGMWNGYESLQVYRLEMPPN